MTFFKFTFFQKNNESAGEKGSEKDLCVYLPNFLSNYY